MSAEPSTISKFETGLVLYQPQQILNDDAFPVSFNVFTYLNTEKRRGAWQLIGRLSRTLTAASLGNSGASIWSFNIYSTLVPPITGEPNAAIDIGTVIITIEAGPDIVFTDQGDGTLTSPTLGNSGTINYATGDVYLTHTAGVGIATEITFTYYPSLPGMGIFDRNTNTIPAINNIFMDTKYTYQYVSGGFVQFPANITWSLLDYQFPSSANYWKDENNNPIFWITNNAGTSGTQIYYTNGTSGALWFPFNPTVDGTNDLWQAKFLVPFRGRFFAFNTWEGTSLAASVNYSNLVRCSAVGTPFTTTEAGVISTVNANAWNDTIPGQGYAQPLPTNEPIQGVWLCMNQIIVKTTTQSFVITHTGMNVAPFKIDLIDEKEGTASGFGGANMGSYIMNVGTRSIHNTSPTSLLGIDKKIINFVFNEIDRMNQGIARVYANRDFINRCNSFIYPNGSVGSIPVTYPNRRLIHNYENGTWAIFEDSLTALGYFRPNLSMTWAECKFPWSEANFSWTQSQSNEPYMCAVNQQGFVGLPDAGVVEDISLQITNITSNGASAATFTSPSHNMQNGAIVQISGIVGTYSGLNSTVAQVSAIDTDTFYLKTLDANNDFTIPVTVGAGTYIGGGLLQVRKNFYLMTKAFNYLKEGQSTHVTYIDGLVNVENGAEVQLQVFDSLNIENPVNTSPQSTQPNSLFGQYLSLGNPTSYSLTQVNNRALINQRANMLSFGFTLDNATMVSSNFSTPFSLSSLTIWRRRAGRPLMPLGGG